MQSLSLLTEQIEEQKLNNKKIYCVGIKNNNTIILFDTFIIILNHLDVINNFFLYIKTI